jgi:transposase-like protein
MKGKASAKKKTKRSRRKNRVFSEEFKRKAAERMQAGEGIRRLSEELGVRRGLLYRWREAYRKEGQAGLCRTAGRPGAQLPGRRRRKSRRRDASRSWNGWWAAKRWTWILSAKPSGV